MSHAAAAILVFRDAHRLLEAHDRLVHNARGVLVPPASAAETSVSLLRRAKEGDDAALDALLRRYRPRLQRWATGRLPRSARHAFDTEDLVQEALLHVLRRLPDLEIRGAGAFYAYARQAILNRVTDAYRVAARREPPDPITSDLPDRAASPLETAIGAQSLARYERGLARLRPDEQQAVILRLELGCSYQEIAESVGKPSADAARVAVTRALARLAQDMSGE